MLYRDKLENDLNYHNYESRFSSFQTKPKQVVWSKINPISNRSLTLVLQNKLNQVNLQSNLQNVENDQNEEISKEEEKRVLHPKHSKMSTQKINNQAFSIQLKDSNFINKKQNFFELKESNSNSKKSNSTPGFMRKPKKGVLNMKKIRFFRDTPFVSYVHPKRYIYEFASDANFNLFKDKYLEWWEEISKHELPEPKRIKLGRIDKNK